MTFSSYLVKVAGRCLMEGKVVLERSDGVIGSLLMSQRRADTAIDICCHPVANMGTTDIFTFIFYLIHNNYIIIHNINNSWKSDSTKTYTLN